MAYLKNIKIKEKTLQFPCFFPDATRGVIRSVSSNQLNEVDTEGLIVNTYHLLSEPGAEVIKCAGGIKSFMHWDGWVISDSGGFQLLSMIYQNASFGTVTEDGVNFRKGSKGNTKSYKFTPEKSIQTQFTLNPDIMICLDDCPGPKATRAEVELCVHRTLAWAKRCKDEFTTQLQTRKLTGTQKPLLFAVIQGGDYKDLRKHCADGLKAIGFDGYGFGGWPLDDGGLLNSDILSYTAELMPDTLPKYALGVGNPQALVDCYKMGYTIFDTVLPTRDARHKRLYVFTKDPRTANLATETNFYDFFYPIREPNVRDQNSVSNYCDCYLCKNFSRSYLNHLYTIEDSLAETLGTIHNLRTYQLLIENLRTYA